MMAHKQRVAYLDYLRLVAILGVITIHVATSLNFYRQDYASLNWQILNFWDGLSRFCVPVFIMISGAIFLNPDFELSWEKLFKKYLRRIVVRYLIWQLIYCGWYYFAKEGDLVTVAKFLIGSYDHLWYLLMIAGLLPGDAAFAAAGQKTAVARILTLAGPALCLAFADRPGLNPPLAKAAQAYG